MDKFTMAHKGKLLGIAGGMLLCAAMPASAQLACAWTPVGWVCPHDFPFITPYWDRDHRRHEQEEHREWREHHHEWEHSHGR